MSSRRIDREDLEDLIYKISPDDSPIHYFILRSAYRLSNLEAMIFLDFAKLFEADDEFKKQR